MRLPGIAMVVIKVNSQVLNTAQLGVAFLTLFSADFTICGLQKLINTSINADNPDYNVDGYISSALIYVYFGIFLFCGPAIVNVCGLRTGMVLGAFMMTMFFFLLHFENTWLTHLGILLNGSGASILWVGQGNYIVLNSETGTVPMHYALFWTLFSLSMVTGNIYVAFSFVGKTRIDRNTRGQLTYTATAVGLLAVVILLFLRPPKGRRDSQPVTDKPAATFKKTISLYFSTEFLILLMAFASVGFAQSFGTVVYISTIGFTNAFGTIATMLVPITAIAYGAGNSLGGSINIITTTTGYAWNRRYAFWSGFIIQVLALSGIYVNIPDQAVFGYTNESSIIQTPLVWLAILCGIGLGIIDGLYNTQIYPLLAHMHPEHGEKTTALYNFTKSLAAAVFFFASTVLSLQVQLVIMVAVGFAGSICFSIVDQRVHRMIQEKTTS